MLKHLLDYKTFCTDVLDSDLIMDETVWQFCSDFVEIFTPVKILTLKLQNEQMNLGDFYGIWMKFKLDLERNGKNKEIIEEFYSNIIKREDSFIKSSLLSAAVYLDIRFRVMLTDDNIAIGKQQILTTIKILKNLNVQNKKNQERKMISTSFTNSSSSESDTDALETILKNKERNTRKVIASSESSYNTQLDVKKEFDVYEGFPRISKDKKILEWWENHKMEIPLLYEASQVVFAVPATQVSVERAFSALKLILQPQRVHLNSKSLQNILFVRLNENFDCK